MGEQTIECYDKLDLAINDTSVIGNPVLVHELTKEE